ncbi:MAG TPA: hypothetical protein VG433_13355 [Pirellulales bacterium]|jgi:hypothetical protein|nr:hypothetical protein [Pirellulales bacterium]
MNTIRNVHGHNYCFIGQLVYESRCETRGEWSDVFSGIGVRLYQDVETQEHFLCVEAGESGEEQWYRADGARLIPLCDDD